MIDIIFPSASKVFDGIGDHTKLLAQGLADRGYRVRVLTRGVSEVDIRGVEFLNVWPEESLRSLSVLKNTLAQDPPTLTILQWEQFSYGHRGYNPEISSLFTWMAREVPASRRILFAHETYTSPTSIRRAAMWSYQRHQVAKLARSASRVFHSSARGVRQLASYNRDSVVLPVFSNIPISAANASREVVGIKDSSFTVLLFGHLDGPRLAYARAGLIAAALESNQPLFVYVGKDARAAQSLADELGLESLIRERAGAQDVANLMRVADLGLAPFPEGVSLRRGSFAAMLANRLPTVTTMGRDTDPQLLSLAAAGAFSASAASSTAFGSEVRALASSGAERAQMRDVLSRLDPTSVYLEMTLSAIEREYMLAGR